MPTFRVRALLIASLSVGACAPRSGVNVGPALDAFLDDLPQDAVVGADGPTPDGKAAPDAPPAQDVPAAPDVPPADAPAQPDAPTDATPPDVAPMDAAPVDAPPPPDASPTDAPPPPDVARPPDAVAPPDAPTDAAPDAPACRSDRDCAASSQVCDTASGRCVDCARDADCLTAGQSCVSNRCVTPTRCTSSRMCPGQVCDTARGLCVDCVADVDCDAGQMCRANTCVRAACAAGSATCRGATSRAVCGADGVTVTVTPCPSAPNATGTCAGAGVCDIACNAGFYNCDGNSANGCESSTTCTVLLGGLGGTTGYGANCLHPNDDGSWAGPPPTTGYPAVAVPITPAFPMGLNYFGTTYNSMYVNNNGNVSFRAALGTYTPMPFPVADQPIIAPWWADVDTRGGGMPMRNNVCFVVQPSRVIVTWHLVGYFSSHDNLQNTFQLVLLDRAETGAGNFDVEFRYAQCQWYVGDASGGTGGTCPGGTASSMCTPAQVGFDAGNRRDYLSLPTSRTTAILDVCRTTNVPGGTPGIWRFQVRGGRVPM